MKSKEVHSHQEPKELGTLFSNEWLESVLKLVDQSEAFCQSLDFNQSIWAGVTYNQKRIIQIDNDIKKLKGFKVQVKLLDVERWKSLREKIEAGNFEDLDISEIRKILKTADVDNSGWLSAAKVEVYQFLIYIDNNLPPFSSLDEANTWLSQVQIGQTVKNFLVEHVGENDHHFSNNSRDGLDGSRTTCPVVKVPHVAAVFFGYLLAEYILMRTIWQQGQPKNF